MTVVAAAAAHQHEMYQLADVDRAICKACSLTLEVVQEGPASNAKAEVVAAYKHLCMSHTLSEVDCATRCVGCRELVSVPEPSGTTVGAQNKRDHVAAACSTELSAT